MSTETTRDAPLWRQRTEGYVAVHRACGVELGPVVPMIRLGRRPADDRTVWKAGDDTPGRHDAPRVGTRREAGEVLVAAHVCSVSAAPGEVRA